MDERFPNFDVKEFLTDQKIDFKVSDADDHEEVMVNCPSCLERGEVRADTKRRLWIAPVKGVFHCYNCDWDGNLVRLVMRLAGVGVRGATRLMRGKMTSLEYLNFPLVHDSVRAQDDDDEDFLPEVAFPHGFQSFDECRVKTPFHRYLRRRGIPLAYAKEMGWGFSTVGFTKDRLVVPTYMDDRLVFWQARDILEEDHPAAGTADYKKVLNPKGASARRVVYGFDALKPFTEIVLVEGFTDAAKVGSQAAAINGKALHMAQVEALTRLPLLRSVVLLLDPDAWKDERYHREGPRRGKVKRASSVEMARSLLSVYFEVRAVRLPDGRDAGSYEMGALDEVLWPKDLRRAAEKSWSATGDLR